MKLFFKPRTMLAALALAACAAGAGDQDVPQVTPLASAPPEPQTHALLLGGLGLMAMGAVARRKGRQGRQGKQA